MRLEFYYHIQSPPCQSVLMVLKELEIEFTEKAIDFKASEQKQEEFLQINPLGRVPAIKHGDFVLAERIKSQFPPLCGVEENTGITEAIRKKLVLPNP